MGPSWCLGGEPIRCGGPPLGAANNCWSWLLLVSVNGFRGTAPVALIRPPWALSLSMSPLGNFCLGLLSMLSSELVLAIEKPNGRGSSKSGPKLEDLWFFFLILWGWIFSDVFLTSSSLSTPSTAETALEAKLEAKLEAEATEEGSVGCCLGGDCCLFFSKLLGNFGLTGGSGMSGIAS